MVHATYNTRNSCGGREKKGSVFTEKRKKNDVTIGTQGLVLNVDGFFISFGALNLELHTLYQFCNLLVLTGFEDVSCSTHTHSSIIDNLVQSNHITRYWLVMRKQKNKSQVGLKL